MRSDDLDRFEGEPRSLFEVMMAMTAEQWDALGLDADDGDEPDWLRSSSIARASIR